VAQCEVAAGLLLDALAARGPAAHVQLPTTLVLRGTTARAPEAPRGAAAVTGP